MVDTSTLFDEYNPIMDWIKKHIVYFLTVDFGDMKMRSELERYISEERDIDLKEKCSFDAIDEKTVPYFNKKFKSYMVMREVNTSK